VVQRQFQLNRKDEFVKAFIAEAIARVVRPLEARSTEEEEPNLPMTVLEFKIQNLNSLVFNL
jgi:hypothetical protein